MKIILRKRLYPESNSVTEAECLLIKKRIISQIPFVHHKWNHICYIKLVVILYTLVTMKVTVNPVYVMTILLFCLKLLRRFSLAFSKEFFEAQCHAFSGLYYYNSLYEFGIWGNIYIYMYFFVYASRYVCMCACVYGHNIGN